MLARAGAATGDREAQRQARRRIADLARVASGPGVMAAVEAVHGFTGTRARAVTCRPRRRCSSARRATCWPPSCGATRRPARRWSGAGRLCAEHGLRRIAARAAAIRALPAPPPRVLDQLTTREREVVTLAAAGLTNREIGERLYLSEGTVRNYLSTAFAKLGVSRRSELGRLVPG